MFRVAEDGSAITYHIPVSPFIPLQHNKIDVTTVNRLANFGMRFAMEHGWCYCLHADAITQQVSEAVDEGYAVPGEDATVFFAGVEADLIGEYPKLDGVITPASVFCWGQFWVSHVGSSSFGIYGKFYRYEADDEDSKVPFGVFRLSAVYVSKTSRKPVPIPKNRAALMRETMEKHNLSTTLPRSARVDIKDFLSRCGLFADSTFSKLVDTLPTHPSVAPLKIAFRREFHIRETDIDFNRHVNQMAMIQLVINTLRSALGDKTTVFPRLLDAGVHHFVGDILLRRLHIDYLRETPMDHRSIVVSLFFLEDAAREAVIATSPGKRLNQLADLCFIAQGVPVDDSPPFISVVGKLSISC